MLCVQRVMLTVMPSPSSSSLPLPAPSIGCAGRTRELWGEPPSVSSPQVTWAIGSAAGSMQAPLRVYADPQLFAGHKKRGYHPENQSRSHASSCVQIHSLNPQPCQYKSRTLVAALPYFGMYVVSQVNFFPRNASKKIGIRVPEML